jgi:hypothetical protein
MRGLVLGALFAVLSVGAFAKKDESKPPAELAATQGFVRVSLPQWAFGNPPTLHARGGKDSYKLVRVVEDGSYAYGAWMPAGRYDIEGMVAADGSPYTPLIVESGRMTDLGAVLRIQLGGYETVLLPIRHPEADAETKAAHSRLASVLAAGDDIRWAPSVPPKSVSNPQPASGLGLIADLISDYERSVNKPRLSKQLKEAPTLDALAALARLAVAPATEESATDSARNLYFGADFGQLRVRHPEGTWGSIDTGTLDEITAVGAADDRIVAGTLRGSLLMSADRGGSWSRVRSLNRDEIVVDIDHAGEAWVVLTAHTSPGVNPWGPVQQLRVYLAKDPGLSDLAISKDFPLPQLYSARILGVSDALVGQVIGSAYIVNTVTDLQKLDLTSMQWSVLPRPPHRVDAFHVSLDGSLITAMRVQGAFSKISVSKDGGATWLPYSRPPYAIYDAVLETPDSGTATRWNSHAFTATLELYSYDSKAKDWHKSSEAPPGCVRLLRDESYRQRFCVSSGGSILDRKDGAWVAEFAVE